MPRPSSTSGAPRLALPAVVAALLLAAFLPAVLPDSLARIPNWFGGLATGVLAPLQHAFRWSISLFQPPPGPPRPADPELQRLQRDLELYKHLYFQADSHRADLERQLLLLQRGLALNPALALRQVPGPVIGLEGQGASRFLLVRAGANQGVASAGSVAVFDAVNLVGRVVEVGSRVSSVLPITQRSAGPLKARAFPGEFLTPDATSPGFDPAAYSLLCELAPTGDGALEGPLEAPRLLPGQAAPELRVGMVVRLADPSWPRSAQMLVVGVVDRIRTAPNDRPILTVRPVYQLPRLAELTIRVSEPDDLPAPDAGAAPPAGGSP